MSWELFLQQQYKQQYFKDLEQFLESEVNSGKDIYPTEAQRFNALSLTSLDSVKVVILGQDPYHGLGQAHGLSFSVPDGIKIPPSLRNIYKELAEDIEGFTIPKTGNLTRWAEQGVLLLNAVLTVEAANAGSHAKKGWEIFTDNLISEISAQRDGVIFLLWGSYAQKKCTLIDSNKHVVLTSTHPSPLSAYRGFFGCKHFSQTNDILRKQGKSPINWSL